MRMKLLIIAVVVCFVSLNIAAEPVKTPAPISYPSPDFVYNVYREAWFKQDWRTVWNCLTPERRTSACYEAYWLVRTNTDASKMEATLTKYGYDSKKFEAEYRQVYEKRRGVKWTASAPEDPDARRDAAFNLVTDQAGLYGEMCIVLYAAYPTKHNELKQLKIQGNQAQGNATTSHMMDTIVPPGHPPIKSEVIGFKELQFEKIHGGWLISQDE